MNNFLKLLLAMFCVATMAAASANTISVTHHIDASGPGSIAYTYFDVDQDDTVDLWTTGTSVDTVMYLMRWDGHLDASDMITFNDDCTKCTSAGGWTNSSITRFLHGGSYVAVIGDYALSLEDVLLGLNNTGNSAFGVKTGDVTLFLSAPNAGIVDPPGPAALVPEPASLALVGFALVLLPVLRRRRSAR